MRNKILVLVLALVCLFAVSALAEKGGDVVTGLDSYQQNEIYQAFLKIENKHEFYKVASPNDEWINIDMNVDSNADYWLASSYTAPNSCKKAGEVYLLCDAAKCDICKKATSFITKDANGNAVTNTNKLAAVKVTVPAKLHTINAAAETKVPGNCAAAGKLVYACSTCGDDFTVTSKNYADYATAIALYDTDVVESTWFTIKGHDFDWNSDEIDAYNAATGKNTELGAPAAHDSKTWIKFPAICGAYATEKEMCTVCYKELQSVTVGTEKGEHDFSKFTYDYYETVATCKQPGEHVYVKVCSICGYNDTSVSREEVIDQIKHNDKKKQPANYLDYQFNADEKTPAAALKVAVYETVKPAKTDANGVSYVTVAKAADVKAAVTGKTGFEFKVTTTGYTVKFTPEYALQGNPSEGARTPVLPYGPYTLKYVAPLCGVDGSVTITCGCCGEKLVYAVKALEHSYAIKSYMNIEDDLEDCTASFIVAFECTVCDYEAEEVVVGEAEHKFSKKVTGYMQLQDDGRTQVYFDKNWNVEKVVVNNKELDSVAGYAYADCVSVYEMYSCENEVLSFETLVAPNLGENYEDNIATFTCQHAKLVEVAVDKDADHETVGATDYYKKDATCTVPGVQKYTCADCGNYIEEELKPTGKHEADKKGFTTVTPATCGVPGVESAVCKHCKEGFTEDIPALIHHYEMDATQSQNVVIADTKVDPITGEVKEYELDGTGKHDCHDGRLVLVCKNCKDKKTITLVATHESGITGPAKERVPSDCKTAGYEIYYCSNCQKDVKITLAKDEHKMVFVTKDTDLSDGYDQEKPIAYVDATCCEAKYYEKICEACGTKERHYVGEPAGHKDLTKEQLKAISDDIKDDGKINREHKNEFGVKCNVVVTGVIDCVNGSAAKMICTYSYKAWDTTTQKPATELTYCNHEWNFTIPAWGHKFELEKNPVTGKLENVCSICEAVESLEADKPEYVIDPKKGTVKLVNKTAAALKQAWVRISYGFELSDGSNIAMVTCMPITFDAEGNGTFSFITLDTSLESTGVNYMVVDHGDAMYKTLGQLIGNNYGMIVE